MIASLISGGHLMVGLQENRIIPIQPHHRIFCHVLSEQTRQRVGMIIEIKFGKDTLNNLRIANPGDTADMTFEIGSYTRKEINKTLSSSLKKPQEIITHRYGSWSSVDLFVYPEYDSLFKEPEILWNNMYWKDLIDSEGNFRGFYVYDKDNNPFNEFLPFAHNDEPFEWMRTHSSKVTYAQEDSSHLLSI